jgi:orotate phosphoribosyltransferase
VSDLRTQIVELVRSRGYRHSAEPFRLASGQLSNDYIDGKLAVSRGSDLALAAQAIVEASGQPFTAVGGLTMGADALAHATAVVSGAEWFSVRKEPKGRGLNRWIEGTRLTADHRVLLVDDVVSTGGSIVQAYDRVVEEGAQVVAVVTLVDRGDVARPHFEALGVSYSALVTYTDLGIVPVGPTLTSTTR